MASTRLMVASPKLEAQLLACHILNIDRTTLLTHPELEINELAGEQLLQRRELHEPLAYILGYREFYGRRFSVNRSVLIPRHETEILVETALELADSPLSVLDIGTGSGCIATTLKLERPSWQVTAVDISQNALEVATRNASDLGAEVEYVESDLFANLSGRTFDLIVSNPPYIGIGEPLPQEVREFEPSVSLFADNHGLAIYERIENEVCQHINPGGRLILEIGQTQREALSNLFPGAKCIRDLDGNDRVIQVQF